MSLSSTEPTKKPSDSLIGTSPVLEFGPLPRSENSSLINYRANDTESYKFWINRLIDFLEEYKKPGLTPGRGQNIHACDYDRPPNPGQVCDVDIKQLAPCIEENHFMYHQSAPCILLKLNKFDGWIPEFYNNSRDLPPDMPNDLKQYIEKLELENWNNPELNAVWVSCKGENPADAEFAGIIKYHPFPGFPGYFFQSQNFESNLSPLVAVQFVRPDVRELINIECRTWAKNIHYEQNGKQGAVHLELLID